MTVNTIQSRIYSVISASDCTISTESGIAIISVTAGVQAFFSAPGDSVTCDNDEAIITLSFNFAPVSQAAIGGSSSVKTYECITPSSYITSLSLSTSTFTDVDVSAFSLLSIADIDIAESDGDNVVSADFGFLTGDADVNLIISNVTQTSGVSGSISLRSGYNYICTLVIFPNGEKVLTNVNYYEISITLEVLPDIIL